MDVSKHTNNIFSVNMDLVKDEPDSDDDMCPSSVSADDPFHDAKCDEDLLVVKTEPVDVVVKYEESDSDNESEDIPPSVQGMSNAFKPEENGQPASNTEMEYKTKDGIADTVVDPSKESNSVSPCTEIEHVIIKQEVMDIPEAKSGSVQDTSMSCPASSNKEAAFVGMSKKEMSPTIRALMRSESMSTQMIKGDEPMHTCKVCKKSFSQQSSLIWHDLLHTEEGKLLCCACKMPFSLLAELKAHRKIHKADRSFPCEICKKSFSTRANLNKHGVVHTGERPFVCEECSRSFARKSDLQVHQRTHTGGRQFLCEICNKTFSKNCYLRDHQRNHTGERPYSCGKCKKSFIRNNDYKRHQRIHARKKDACF